MSFLSKFGSALLKGIQVVSGLSPVLSGINNPIVNKVEDSLMLISGAVATVEAIGQALNIHGPDKVKAAAPLISQVILQSSFMLNKKIDNPELFNKACAAIGSDFADLMNSLHEDSVKTESKT